MNIKTAKAFRTLSYKHHAYWQEFVPSGLLYMKRYELIRQLITTSSMMHLWK